MFRSSSILRNIWGCLLLLAEGKKLALLRLKKVFGKKMQGWKEKLLSQVGKEVMIKVVVQFIPTYSMSMFKLPVGLCKDIKAMIQKFLWGQGE